MFFSTQCLFGSIESAECRSLTSHSRAKILASPLCKPIGGFRCGLCSLYTCYRCTTKPKKFSYTPPRIGGNFKVTTKAFVRFPYLKHFSKHKALSALLLEEVNRVHGFGIATHSAAAEIVNPSQGWDILNNISMDEMRSPTIELSINIQLWHTTLDII